MHRTDTIDWLVVLEGSASWNIRRARRGAPDHLAAGGVPDSQGGLSPLAQRSDHTCTLLAVTFPAVRKETGA